MCAHPLWLPVLEVKVTFVGSGPRGLPVGVVAGSKHVASILEGFLSLRPPFLIFTKFSGLSSWAWLNPPLGELDRHSGGKCDGVVAIFF
jgi:hypothetical protein